MVQNHPHHPVLCSEIVEAFSGRSCATFVDGTLGAGGHASAILQNCPEIERYIGIDQDPFALELAEKRLTEWQQKFSIIRGNFAEIHEHLTSLNILQVDAILVDLGVSSMQLDQAERGFSLMRDGPLDMRMNPQQSLSAATIVNEWSEQEIGRILRDFGEEKQWRAIARVIVSARNQQPIVTTKQLVDVVIPIVGWRRGQGIHPLTLTFQAFRMAVNDELGVIKKFLPQTLPLLKQGGRLAIISFHSLEDRLIKQFFRETASDKENYSGLGGLFIDKQPQIKILTNRPITATESEISSNPRSRSAKLRIAEKL